MSLITRLFFEKRPSEDTRRDAYECPHMVLIPAWEIPEKRQDAGALDFVCESCGMPFTAADSPAANRATIRRPV